MKIKAIENLQIMLQIVLDSKICFQVWYVQSDKKQYWKIKQTVKPAVKVEKTNCSPLKSGIHIDVHWMSKGGLMPTGKNALNEINKEGTFTWGFKDCREIQRKVSKNLEHLQKLLIKLANC